RLDGSCELPAVSASVHRQQRDSACGACCGDSHVWDTSEDEPGGCVEGVGTVDLSDGGSGAGGFAVSGGRRGLSPGLRHAAHKSAAEQPAIHDQEGTGAASDFLSDKESMDIRNRIADLQLRSL